MRRHAPFQFRRLRKTAGSEGSTRAKGAVRCWLARIRVGCTNYARSYRRAVMSASNLSRRPVQHLGKTRLPNKTRDISTKRGISWGVHTVGARCMRTNVRFFCFCFALFVVFIQNTDIWWVRCALFKHSGSLHYSFGGLTLFHCTSRCTTANT